MMKDRIDMNVFEVTKTSNHSTEEKHAAVIYLSEVSNHSVAMINEFTGYAKSTIRNILRNVTRKAIDFAKSLFEFVRETLPVKSNQFCAYILEFFDERGDFKFLKVGMTNNLNRRINEHTRKYKLPVCKVKYVVNTCDNEDAEIIESTLRKHYKAKDNCGFISRDRFTGCRFNEEDLLSNQRLLNQLDLIAA